MNHSDTSILLFLTIKTIIKPFNTILYALHVVQLHCGILDSDWSDAFDSFVITVAVPVVPAQ